MTPGLLPAVSSTRLRSGSFGTSPCRTKGHGFVPRTSCGVSSQHKSVHRLHAASDDVDVAVFRFTLGIAGFDDRLIPRVVGGLGLVLLGINHLIGDPQEAQERTEFITAFLCAVLLVAPWLEERLTEARPGRGRSAVGEVKGATNCFHLAAGLNDAIKKELAWASYALLLNTNCCGFILVDPAGQPLCVRGALGSTVVSKAADATLSNVAQAIAPVIRPGLPAANLLSGGQQSQIYAADRAGMTTLQLDNCPAIAEGVECVLLQSLQAEGGSKAQGLLLLLSERSGGLSERDCLWAGAIASKLAGVLTAPAAAAV